MRQGIRAPLDRAPRLESDSRSAPWPEVLAARPDADCDRSSQKPTLRLALHGLLQELAALVGLVELFGYLHRYANLLGEALIVGGRGHKASLFHGFAGHKFLCVLK